MSIQNVQSVTGASEADQSTEANAAENQMSSTPGNVPAVDGSVHASMAPSRVTDDLTRSPSTHRSMISTPPLRNTGDLTRSPSTPRSMTPTRPPTRPSRFAYMENGVERVLYGELWPMSTPSLGMLLRMRLRARAVPRRNLRNFSDNGAMLVGRPHYLLRSWVLDRT